MKRAQKPVLTEVVNPLLAPLVAVAFVTRHRTVHDRVVIRAARRRLAAARDELADAEAAVVAIRVAVAADLVDAVAERLLAREHAVAENETAHQGARAEVVVPDVVLHVPIFRDGSVVAEYLGRIVLVGVERLAAALAHLEILSADVDDA